MHGGEVASNVGPRRPGAKTKVEAARRSGGDDRGDGEENGKSVDKEKEVWHEARVWRWRSVVEREREVAVTWIYQYSTVQQ